MKLIQIYMNALRLPKKQARIFLNKTNLTQTLLYLFSLVILINLPGFIGVLMKGNEKIEGLFVLQYLILGPFFAAFALLAGISITAFVLVVTAKMFKRNLKYQYLWKMAVFSLPLPILIAFLIDFIIQNDTLTAAAFLIVFFSIHLKMISDFPKRKQN
ncbi:DUF1189 domain-containing protein [Bacillus salacetis]|uniref:DUF1189 domain-containing protein n=1 Tax=Bacillus salacetis TaxID=2315464 RepID=A0A3A1R2G1_9BACI|nr:DUF1189 family protein [Bacillus salacetis]RIW34692.1 DUF1189 domain-containing protein [Bacillus salacetis]